MRRSRYAAILAIGTLLCLGVTPAPATATPTQPWLDASQSPEKRAAELVAQMTLDEKITE
jgi:beta-glucosidase